MAMIKKKTSDAIVKAGSANSLLQARQNAKATCCEYEMIYSEFVRCTLACSCRLDSR